jgi:glycine dehydrogenase
MRLFEREPFASRHIGPDRAECDRMLEVVSAASLDALIDEAIPTRIRLKTPLDLPDGESEYEFLRDLRGVASRNQIFRSFIGLGYYDCVTPSVILRNVLENPGWYTPYTPYQAEIAQGRLESLLNFQTMVRDLTGMQVANASLLDEATAAAEAMTMLHRVQARRIESIVGPPQFLVSDSCYPQTTEVLRARAEPLGIEIVLIPNLLLDEARFDDRVFGVLVQSPDEAGRVHDLRSFISRAKQAGVLVAVGSDLLSLVLLTPPGELGADVVYGNSQRFGVPLGYGGPHAAFFATLEKHVRQAPGRIIGVSTDAHGNTAYRMSLQTREQHIRREKATSNICTAQALNALCGMIYLAWLGRRGIVELAELMVQRTAYAREKLSALQGVSLLHDQPVVREFAVRLDAPVERVRQRCWQEGVDPGYPLGDDGLLVAVTEQRSAADIDRLAEVLGAAIREEARERAAV